MKSVGEVMAIGRTFEECFQKALRIVDPAIKGYEPRPDGYLKHDLDHELKQPSDRRAYAIAVAMYQKGYTVDQIHELTNIDKWFLHRLNNIVEYSNSVKGADIESIDANKMLK